MLKFVFLSIEATHRETLTDGLAEIGMRPSAMARPLVRGPIQCLAFYHVVSESTVRVFLDTVSLDSMSASLAPVLPVPCTSILLFATSIPHTPSHPPFDTPHAYCQRAPIRSDRTRAAPHTSVVCTCLVQTSCVTLAQQHTTARQGRRPHLRVRRGPITITRVWTTKMKIASSRSQAITP